MRAFIPLMGTLLPLAVSLLCLAAMLQLSGAAVAGVTAPVDELSQHLAYMDYLLSGRNVWTAICNCVRQHPVDPKRLTFLCADDSEPPYLVKMEGFPWDMPSTKAQLEADKDVVWETINELRAYNDIVVGFMEKYYITPLNETNFANFVQLFIHSVLAHHIAGVEVIDAALAELETALFWHNATSNRQSKVLDSVMDRKRILEGVSRHFKDLQTQVGEPSPRIGEQESTKLCDKCVNGLKQPRHIFKLIKFYIAEKQATQEGQSAS